MLVEATVITLRLVHFFSGRVIPHLGQGPGVSRSPPSMEHLNFCDAEAGLPEDDPPQPAVVKHKTSTTPTNPIQFMMRLKVKASRLSNRYLC